MKKNQWPQVSLGDVCVFEYGSALPEKNRRTGKYPVMGSNGIIGWHDAFLVNGPSIIVGRKGSAGEVVWVDEDSFPIDTTYYAVENEKVSKRFLYYVLLALDLPSLRGGGAVPGLNRNDAYRQRILLPSLAEQTEIVSALDVAMNLKKKREEADKKMAAFAPALFYEMFGDAAKNEKGWEVKKLGEVTDIVAGSTPSSRNPDFWNGDINWVTPAEMKNESFYITDTERKITKQGFEDCSTKMFPQGSVILSTRAPIGKVAIAGVEMCSNQGIKALITKSSVNNIYLFWWLKQQTDYLNSLGSGATFKELSSTTLKSVSIPVPPPELQKKFADRITEMRALQEEQSESRKKLEEVFDGVINSLL